MPKARNGISIDLLHEYLIYNSETGILTWKRRASIRVFVGKEAGCKMNGGYIAIRVRGTSMLAHRVAWAMHYGVWPPHEIDHINRQRTDNRIANLRLATRAENACNAPCPTRNRLGVKGVGKKRNRYLARLWDGKRSVSVGRYDTLEEAKQAYDEAARKLRGEFSSST